VPGFVVQLHLHQHVAGEELALALALLPRPHFHDFFRRHENIAEAVLHAERSMRSFSAAATFFS
jgi:hypothetical protein